MAGDIAVEIMKTINDVPNNVGQGVWPWNGQSVYGTGRGANSTLQASMLAWNDAFAKNVVESDISVPAVGGEVVLPETVKSLDVATGEITDVPVVWDAVPEDAAGTFTVAGQAQVEVPAEGRGKAMTDVTATVTVVDAIPEGAVVGGKTVGKCGEGEKAAIDVYYVGDEPISSIRLTLDSQIPIDSVESPHSFEYNPANCQIIVWNEYGECFGAGKLFTVNYDLDVLPWYAEGEYALKMTNIKATDNVPDHVALISYDGTLVIDNDYFPGDVTLDGIIDNRDLIMIARYLVQLVEFNESQLEAADYNDDGVIDNKDLVLISRALVAQ